MVNSTGLSLAAYQPDNPLNVGAMIRLCACLGVVLEVIEPCGFPFSLRAVRQKALDYAGLAEIRRHASWEAFRATPRGRLILLTTRGAVPLWDYRFQPCDTLLTGRESAGVPDTVHAVADAAVAIPMPGGGRSLNVAMAAAIALAEARRQLDRKNYPHPGLAPRSGVE